LLPLAACGYSHHDHHELQPGTEPDPPLPLVEIEPNDHASTADYLGEYHPGDYVAVEGHITECCVDPYDGFAIYAPYASSVYITLHEDSPGADLDFCIYDPVIDEMIACWESDSHPEGGIFDYAGGGEFHIVVDSWIGDTTYLLEIDMQPLAPAASFDPGSPPAAQRALPAPSALAHERLADYLQGQAEQLQRRALLLQTRAGETLLRPIAPGSLTH